jgi:predicted DNA-binding ribbon-helix-helix protein
MLQLPVIRNRDKVNSDLRSTKNSVRLSIFLRILKVRDAHHRHAPNQFGGRKMKSTVIKRSVVIAGHKTSVSLEDVFWNALKDIACVRDINLSDLVGKIDTERQQGNLSSAIRMFVLDFYRDQIFEHEKRDKTREILRKVTVLIAQK